MGQTIGPSFARCAKLYLQVYTSSNKLNKFTKICQQMEILLHFLSFCPF